MKDKNLPEHDKGVCDMINLERRNELNFLICCAHEQDTRGEFVNKMTVMILDINEAHPPATNNCAVLE